MRRFSLLFTTLRGSIYRSTTSAMLAVFVTAGCAQLPHDADESTSFATGEVATTNANVTSTPVTWPAGFAMMGPSAAEGLAMRWRLNPNLCISRSSPVPTLDDAIVLAACANTNSQAWAISHGYLMADANLCVGGLVVGQPFRLVACNDANTQKFAFNGGAVYSLLTSSSALFADSVVATAGTPLHLGATTGGADLTPSFWDFTGVGARAGGVLSFMQSPNHCLTTKSGILTLAPCSATDANFRWAMMLGDLATNQNMCVVGTVPDPNVTLVPCAQVSNTSANNQGWYFFSEIQYATLYNNRSYQLSVDDSNQNIVFIPSTLHSSYLWGARLIPEAN